MQQPGNLQVVLLGLVTVFIALVCIIFIIKLMSAIIRSLTKNSAETRQAAPAVQASPAAAVSAPSADKQQFVAAVAAAIAEEMGTDVSHIKIHSIRKI